MKKILIIAGDKSGDLYGGQLCKKLKNHYGQVELYSIGGAHLANNSKQLTDLLSQSVSGLVEVLSSIFNILKIFNFTLKKIEELKPDLIILIDFPDFNLRLAKKLNKRYPLFYYVSPQIWAWRSKRVKVIKKYVHKMIVLFKLEDNFYKEHGVDVLYFGHPLIDTITRGNFSVKPIISLMPGSRKNEVKKHLDVMQKAKDILKKKLPGYSFQIIRAPNLSEDFYKKFKTNIPLVEHSHKALEESKFIICASGTATIEIAILEVPYLIIYKVNTLTWWIIKRLVKTKFAGMVNILQSQKIVEELLQNQATPQNIVKITMKYLEHDDEYLFLKSQLAKTINTLKPHGAIEGLADYIATFLDLKPEV